MTAAVSPSSFPQSSTGRFDVRLAGPTSSAGRGRVRDAVQHRNERAGTAHSLQRAYSAALTSGHAMRRCRGRRFTVDGNNGGDVYENGSSYRRDRQSWRL